MVDFQESHDAAWRTVGYCSAQSTPKKVPGGFTASVRPGLLGGAAYELAALPRPILDTVSAVLSGCLWSCVLRKKNPWKVFDDTEEPNVEKTSSEDGFCFLSQ